MARAFACGLTAPEPSLEKVSAPLPLTETSSATKIDGAVALVSDPLPGSAAHGVLALSNLRTPQVA
jgi:hypothetical protein